MKARSLVAVVLIGLGVYACSSSDPAPSAPAGTTPPVGTGPSGTPSPTGTTEPTPGPVTQTVGATGGAVKASGIVMTVPAGALPSDTSISITPSNDTLPVGYAGLSPLYTFAPDGTVFDKPVTVEFTLASLGTEPTVYWSNASGGFDELPTTVTATGVTASIQHFSSGFVAEKKKHPAADAGSDDASTSDAATADSGASDSGAADSGASDAAVSDAGTSGITTTIDGVVTTFSANAFVTVGGGTTTISADDNATSTHWTLQIAMTGVPQQACQPQGNPTMTYTHYTSGSVDAVYSSKSAQGACILLLSQNPTMAGQHAVGRIMSATLGVLSGPSVPATHTFASGTFDITL